MGVKDFAPPCRSVMLVKGGDGAVRAVGFNAIAPSTRAPALAGARAYDTAPWAYYGVIDLPVGLHVDRRGERGYGLSIFG